LATKYIKQKDKISCVPVAIFNSLRWAGYSIPLTYLSNLKTACETSILGTPRDAIEPCFKGLRYQMSYQRLYKPDTRKLYRFISNGYGIVLITNYTDIHNSECCHCVFLNSVHTISRERYFNIINLSSEEDVSTIVDESHLIALLSKRPVVWLAKPKRNKNEKVLPTE
jgi:hypothetical protein